MNERFRDPTLSPAARVRDLLSRLTLEEKISMLSTHAPAIERLGIREWYIGQEIARGMVNREEDCPTTVFPQPIGMAASFDRDMMRQIGETAGRECRVYYNTWPHGRLMVWGPTVDLCRHPLWGRVEECYGEDPVLAGELAAAYTLGLRGKESVWATIPTLKHFCANDHEEGRASDNADLSPRLRHEYYYEAFRRPIVDGGAHAVMTAYNEVCHVPAVMMHDLRDVLKKQWGLGFVVTDGADFTQNVAAHGFDSLAKSLQCCLYAGADIMTDTAPAVTAAAERALAQGLISESDIDEAVGNMLESRVLLGHFDTETPYDHLTRADVNTDADKALNLRAAREGFVLLENASDTLPLDPAVHKHIGLFGPNADCILRDWYTGISTYQVTVKEGLAARGCDIVHDLGWDIVTLQAPNGRYVCIGAEDVLTADADREDAAQFYLCVHDEEERWVDLREVQSGRYVRIDGQAVHLGGQEVYGWFTNETLRLGRTESDRSKAVLSDYLHGNQLTVGTDGKLSVRRRARRDSSVLFTLTTVSVGTERLAKAAAGCDAVVYCAGNDPMQVARECYDRRTLRLPPVQTASLHALRTATDAPVVLMIVSSCPYALGKARDDADAILWTSHAGPELGHAAADILFGDVSPSGRLPITWYAADEDLPSIKRYDIMTERLTYLWFDGEPLYPFGHGLSYAKLRYEGAECSLTDEGICVRATISNTSDRDTDEVVQIYAHACSTRIERPRRQLVGFTRVTVPAGQTVTFCETVPLDELRIWDVSRDRFLVEAGRYDILLGRSSEDICAAWTFDIPGETVPPRDLHTETPADRFDRQVDTEIYTDPLTGVTHVRALHWNSTLTFQSCDLTGAKEIVLKAASIFDWRSIWIHANGQDWEAPVPPSDSFTDFQTVTVAIPETGICDLVIELPEWCSLCSIQIR